MCLGKGATYTASSKQKLNTKSSTESELVEINDTMAQVIWTRHFLTTQGMYVPTATIYQDSKSTIPLCENGKQSSSRCGTHIPECMVFLLQSKLKKLRPR